MGQPQRRRSRNLVSTQSFKTLGERMTLFYLLACGVCRVEQSELKGWYKLTQESNEGSCPDFTRAILDDFRMKRLMVLGVIKVRAHGIAKNVPTLTTGLVTWGSLSVFQIRFIFQIVGWSQLALEILI